MAKQAIALGTTANDGTGDTLRAAGTKINANFSELYTLLGGDSAAITTYVSFGDSGIVFEGSTADAYETKLIVEEPASSDKTVTIPNHTGTVVLDTATQTLTNKTITAPTITSPVVTTPQINDTSSNHQYVFAVAELAADRNVNLPLLTDSDEFTFNAHTQTLSNKTIASPRITTQISDANGAELIKFTATGSAVNEITYANAATGNNPTITPSGGDANVGLNLAVKGKASVVPSKIAYGHNVMTADGIADSDSTYIVCNKASGLVVALNPGTTVGETKIFTNKNSGTAVITPHPFAQGSTITITQWEAAQCIWDGTNWFMIGNQGAGIA